MSRMKKSDDLLLAKEMITAGAAALEVSFGPEQPGQDYNKIASLVYITMYAKKCILTEQEKAAK